MTPIVFWDTRRFPVTLTEIQLINTALMIGDRAPAPMSSDTPDGDASGGR